MTKNIYFIKNRVIVQHQEHGQPITTEEFLEVRGGLAWPTASSPGYFCLFGLKNVPTLRDKKPLVLLDEDEARLPREFFEKLVISDKYWFCRQIYADLGEEHRGLMNSFREFIQIKRLDGISLQNSSSFFNLHHSALIIKELERDNNLIIPEGILRDQLRKVPGDVKLNEFEKDFYAIAALTRALLSFEIYPWRDDSLDILTKAREQYDPLRYGLETEIQENPIKFGLE